MTRRFGLITVATLLLGVGTLFVWRHSLRRELPLAQLPAQEMERKGQGDDAQGVPYNSKAEKPVRFDELPPHIRQAAQELVHFAAAARLFNFNPQITDFREDVHPFRKDVTNVVIETATHGASFINGRMDKVFSLYDGSDERRKPEVVKEWYKCTGKWTKDEAIQEALGILQRLGDTETLNAVLPGKRDYRATEMGNVARTPDGQRTHVRPFHKVELYDATGTRRVAVEFRMGPTGVVGVTEFWRWP